jgi:hypothetical protein
MSNNVKSCHSCHYSCRHTCHLYSVVVVGIFNKVRWVVVGQKVFSRPSADSFAVGRKQKERERCCHILTFWFNITISITTPTPLQFPHQKMLFAPIFTVCARQPVFHGVMNATAILAAGLLATDRACRNKLQKKPSFRRVF